ncbi:MAG: DUF2029 domain-containing protein [Candidatus Eremiobacteraeota bacterium]|nr:DUF2029 domain-containing protein [Candidatus Eremiobacteraeota bacterium]
MRILQDSAQRNVLLFLAVVLSLAFYSFIGIDIVLPRVPHGFDFMHFYSGILALKLGIRDIYSGEEYEALATQLSQGRWHMTNSYFPGFYVFMLPLSGLSFDDAYLAFTAVTLLSYLLITAWLGQQLFRQRPLGAVAGIGLGVFSIYTGAGIDCLALGQVGFAIAALVSLAYLLSRRNQPLLAGAVLGASALVKAWPAFLILYFLSRKLWKSVFGFFLGYCLPCLMAACLWGVSSYPYLFRALKALGYQPNRVNQSLTGWLTYCCGLDLATTRLLHGVLGVLLVAGLAVLHHRKPRFPRALQYGLYLICACILAPWSWPHHRVVLIFPLIALLERTTRRKGYWDWLGASSLATLLLLDGEIMIDRVFAYLHFRAAESGMIFILMVCSCFCIVAAGWNDEERETPGA